MSYISLSFSLNINHIISCIVGITIPIILYSSYKFLLKSKTKNNNEKNKLIFNFEKEYNAELMTIINKNKKLSYIQSLFSTNKNEEYINLSLADKFITKFRKIPEDRNIIIVIHTPGGELSSAEIICKLIKNHKGKVTAIVPNYAYSAGTIISLACDEIIASKTSIFGPVDPQFIFPVNTIIKAVKNISGGDDSKTNSIEQLFKIESEKAMSDVKKLLYEIVDFSLPEDYNESEDIDGMKLKEYKNQCINKLINDLVDGELLHGHPILASELKKYNIKITIDDNQINDISQKLSLDNY
jgi:hypothetical protein